MGEITLILGGARSGKSRFAQSLIPENSNNTAYIATYQPLSSDKEMLTRINLHVQNRPSSWKTYEEPYEINSLLNSINNKYDNVIIDCFTIFTSNLLFKNHTEQSIQPIIEEIMLSLENSSFNTFIVANEVGLSIVPENKLGRQFRDMAGRVNQLTAKHANNVYFVIAGIPSKIK